MAKFSGRIKGAVVVRGTDSGIYDLVDTVETPLSESSAQGQAQYTSPGTYSWIAPIGVSSVCVVCVGGGGGGTGYFGCAGAGGGLAYKNNIPVVPGNSYSVTVGAAGSGLSDDVARNLASGANSSGNGGTSSFSTFVSATGGQHGYGLSGPTSPLPLGGQPSAGALGGTGGTCEGNYSLPPNYMSSGGGGAGGYSGNGGKGAGSATSGHPLLSATGGAGGGGGGGGSRLVNVSNSYGGCGGGGTGIFGEGLSGVAGGIDSSTSASTLVTDVIVGKGGSGGSNGNYSTDVTNARGGSGGFPGGGGDTGHGQNPTSVGGDGGHGAVRIIWGDGRAFPSTNTGDV